MPIIYMDNNATTRVHNSVIRYMIPFMNEIYGNCSSSHGFGKRCKRYLEHARKKIAKSLKVMPQEIIFCSGATEANNNCLRGVFAANKHRGKHIIVTGIEHASILKTCEDLKKRHRAKITYIPVDKHGFVTYKSVIKCVKPDTIMCIIMSENNEIGTRQKPSILKKIGNYCQQNNIHFHCDATQTIGHRLFYPKKLNIGSLVFSSHKFHGPRGIGCLFIDSKSSIIPCCSTGGMQEWGKRAGTENLAAIMGMMYALNMNLEKNRLQHTQIKILRMRKFMKEYLCDHIDNIIINGPTNQKLCKFNTLSICLPNINSRKLLPYLDKFNIYVNIGSACSRGKRSHVLKACGILEEYERGLLRISLSEYNTMKECKFVCKILCKLYSKYRGKIL